MNGINWITMRFFVILSVVFSGVASSCSAPEQAEETDSGEPSVLLGMWIMNTVFEDTVNVTDVHNPALNRWIEFRKEGTFESGGAPYGYNSGKWVMEQSSDELFLDSDAGDDDDSYWIVNISQDSMHWKGSRTDFAQRFTITFRKKGF